MKPLTNAYKSKNHFAGFTLIELIVVVAIIGILVAIVLPKITQALKSARQGRTVSRINAIRTAANMYFSDHYEIPGNNEYPYQLIQIFQYDENGGLQGCTFHNPPHYYLSGRVSNYSEEVGDGSKPGYQITDWCTADGSWHKNRSVEAGASKGGYNWCGGDPPAHLPLSGTVWIDEDELIMGGIPANQY